MIASCLPAQVVLGVLLVAALFGVGCGKGGSLPKTYPVTGSVVTSDGKPVARASVLFVPLEDTPDISVNGDTGEHGKFTLHTVNVRTKEKTSGAPFGTSSTDSTKMAPRARSSCTTCELCTICLRT